MGIVHDNAREYLATAAEPRKKPTDKTSTLLMTRKESEDKCAGSALRNLGRTFPWDRLVMAPNPKAPVNTLASRNTAQALVRVS
jgi:hypothetical protein